MERAPRAIEEYLYTGKAPTAELQTFFDQIKEFLRNIAGIIRGDLTEDARALFDRMLGAPEEARGTETRQDGNAANTADNQVMDITKRQQLARLALDEKAEPMLEVEYTNTEYNRLFPEGKVETPIGMLRMGKDQFFKLGRKDSGARQSYIGAAYQTLNDPILILQEGTDNVFIKSFTSNKTLLI